MAATVSSPRGMRDFLPTEKAQRERVLDVIRDSYRAQGFAEIETPVMEDSGRLHAGLGGDNEKLAFAVMKRALTVDDLHAATEPLELADLGLRFDLTVPLARFYATHRADLPSVFRSIQIGPVWRAERPQKGRYRQFVQCDIDIIGEAGALAEVELITATVATLDALGVEGTSIRLNDRRLLTSALTILGFPAREHEPVLITVDKLDKLGHDGVIAELRSRGFPDEPVSALEAFFRHPVETEFAVFGEEVITALLPDGVDPVAVAELAAIGMAVDAVLGHRRSILEFDPWLVRGMGYYTGTIFEVARDGLPYSLGGGGRYDGMIGRFLGENVPAAGFSFGFERLVDVVELPGFDAEDAVTLVYDRDTPPATLVALKAALIARGSRVRLALRPKNMRSLLEMLNAEGYLKYAYVNAQSSVEQLEFRAIGG